MVKAKTTETATAAKAPKTPVKKAVKAETKPAAKASKAAPKEEAPAEDAPAAPPAPAAAAVPEIDGSLIAQSGEFLTKLQQVSALLTSLKTEYRALEKKWTRTLTVAQKQNSKRKRKASTRSPSGFVKPTRISDELASFLSQPSGVEMARTDVTRSLNAYIREHNLQDKENGRKINPDQKLAKLLKVGKDDTLTYFNLQRYMSPHFAKAAAAAAAAATSA